MSGQQNAVVSAAFYEELKCLVITQKMNFVGSQQKEVSVVSVFIPGRKTQAGLVWFTFLPNL